MFQLISKKLKDRDGFTLVELLVVIVILGVLAGIGVQQFGAITERANETANAANIRLIKGAAQMYIFNELAENGTVDAQTTGVAGVTLLETEGFLDEVPEPPGDFTAYEAGWDANGENLEVGNQS